MPTRYRISSACTGAAGEHDDAVARADERFEALFDVRQDHELVDDRVRRLRGDDAGLCQADVAPRHDALLRMADRGAFHRPFHCTRAAAGADVESAQSELVADTLGVLVLVAVDGMPAPAHDDVRPHARHERASVTQHTVDRVGDALRIAQLEAAVL
jgi:hypothetical protein